MLKIRGHSIAHLDPLEINTPEVPENSTTKAIHASFNFGKLDRNSESTWLRYIQCIMFRSPCFIHRFLLIYSLSIQL